MASGRFSWFYDSEPITSRWSAKQELIVDPAQERQCETEHPISPLLFLPGMKVVRLVRDRRKGKP